MKEQYKRFAVTVVITCVLLFGLFVIFAEAMKNKLENDYAIPYDSNPATSAVHVKKPDALELNGATFEELLQVKGIGREFAHDIISYREKHGDFTSVKQLMDVRTMDKETFSFIERQLYVEEEWNRFLEEQNPQVENKININTATVRELMSLDSVTESLAHKIVEYREQNGAFASINEIMDVKGIGEGIFEVISDYITV